MPSSAANVSAQGEHVQPAILGYLYPLLFLLLPSLPQGAGYFLDRRAEPGAPQQTLAAWDAAAPDHEPQGSAAPRGLTGFDIFSGQQNCPASFARKGCSRRYSRPLEPSHCPGQTSRVSEAAGCAGAPAPGMPVTPWPVPGTLIRVKVEERQSWGTGVAWVSSTEGSRQARL